MKRKILLITAVIAMITTLGVNGADAASDAAELNATNITTDSCDISGSVFSECTFYGIRVGYIESIENDGYISDVIANWGVQYELQKFFTSYTNHKFGPVTVSGLMSGSAYTWYLGRESIPSAGFWYRIYQNGKYTYIGDEVYFETRPVSPSVTVTSATNNSVNIDWTSTNGSATTYSVYCNGVLKASGLTSKSYTITGLTSGSSNSTYVRASTSSGYADSATINAMTQPVSPTVSVQSTTSGAISITWSDNNGSATRYKTYLNNIEKASNLSTKSYTFTGLSSDTAYNIKVEAITSTGSASSIIYSFSTAPAVPVITQSTTNTASIVLVWADSNSSGTTYKVYRDTSLLISGLTAKSYTASGLYPGSNYTFKVEAVNSGGTTSSNDYIFATQPSAPSLTQSDTTETSIKVIWTDSNGSATRYDLYLNEDAIASNITQKYSVADGLIPGTVYKFKVKAHTGGGYSETSIYSFKTAGTPPPDPVEAVAENITALKDSLDNLRVDVGLIAVNNAEIASGVGNMKSEMQEIKREVAVPEIVRIAGFNGASVTTTDTITIVIDTKNADELRAYKSNSSIPNFGSSNMITIKSLNSGANTIIVEVRNSMSSKITKGSIVVFRL